MVSQESKFTEQIGDMIGERYKIVRIIGNGNYGTVFKCVDIKKNNESVAIKKLHRLEDKIDGQRVLSGDLGDIHLVTDLLEIDLYSVLKNNQILTDEHAQYFVYQILRTLKYLHSASIVHRNIKPSNILLSKNDDFPLCDFGLDRSIEQEQVELAQYIVTNFYRAPEILLCSLHCNKAVDIWSAGCILGEILAKKILFPGSNYVKQINYIIDFLGTPNQEDMEYITNSQAKKYIQSMEPKLPKDLKQYISPNGNANPLAIDLLEKMLKFNPKNRITIDEALQHPYLEAIHDPEYEPTTTDVIDCEFEKQIIIQ